MAVRVELEKVSGLSSAQTPVRVATPVDYTTLYLGQQCLRDCVTLCLLPATVELLSETRTGDRGCKPHSKCSKCIPCRPVPAHGRCVRPTRTPRPPSRAYATPVDVDTIVRRVASGLHDAPQEHHAHARRAPAHTPAATAFPSICPSCGCGYTCEGGCLRFARRTTGASRTRTHICARARHRPYYYHYYYYIPSSARLLQLS